MIEYQLNGFQQKYIQRKGIDLDATPFLLDLIPKTSDGERYLDEYIGSSILLLLLDSLGKGKFVLANQVLKGMLHYMDEYQEKMPGLMIDELIAAGIVEFSEKPMFLENIPADKIQTTIDQLSVIVTNAYAMFELEQDMPLMTTEINKIIAITLVYLKGVGSRLQASGE